MTIVSFMGRPVLASETITVDNTAGGVGFTATKYRKAVQDNSAGNLLTANSAFCTVEDQEIRVNLDPAVTVEAGANGHEFGAGSTFTVEGAGNIRNFRAIRTGGSSGVLRVTYYA